MRDRGLLHNSRLDDFVTWAAGQDYAQEPPKGPYEVLRLKREGEPPVIYHERSGWRHQNPQHITAHGLGLKLVRRFIQETKCARSWCSKSTD